MSTSSDKNEKDGNNDSKHEDSQSTFIPKAKSNKKFRKKRNIEVDEVNNSQSNSKQEGDEDEDYAYDI